MKPSRELFIDECVKALYETNRKFGYSTISIETLKLILSAFCKKYSPPRNPGTIPAPLADKIRTENHFMHKVPPMYQCDKCGSIKPQSGMQTVVPKPGYGGGYCKDCSKKVNPSNVIKINFRR